MNGHCDFHTFEKAVDVCGLCYGDLCRNCALPLKGRKDKVCKDCALTISGVRGAAKPQVRGDRSTVKARRAEYSKAEPPEDYFRFFDEDLQPSETFEDPVTAATGATAQMKPPETGDSSSQDEGTSGIRRLLGRIKTDEQLEDDLDPDADLVDVGQVLDQATSLDDSSAREADAVTRLTDIRQGRAHIPDLRLSSEASSAREYLKEPETDPAVAGADPGADETEAEQEPARTDRPPEDTGSSSKLDELIGRTALPSLNEVVRADMDSFEPTASNPSVETSTEHDDTDSNVDSGYLDPAAFDGFIDFNNDDSSLFEATPIPAPSQPMNGLAPPAGPSGQHADRPEHLAEQAESLISADFATGGTNELDSTDPVPLTSPPNKSEQEVLGSGFAIPPTPTNQAPVESSPNLGDDADGQSETEADPASPFRSVAALQNEEPVPSRSGFDFGISPRLRGLADDLAAGRPTGDPAEDDIFSKRTSPVVDAQPAPDFSTDPFATQDRYIPDQDAGIEGPGPLTELGSTSETEAHAEPRWTETTNHSDEPASLDEPLAAADYTAEPTTRTEPAAPEPVAPNEPYRDDNGWVHDTLDTPERSVEFSDVSATETPAGSSHPVESFRRMMEADANAGPDPTYSTGFHPNRRSNDAASNIDSEVHQIGGTDPIVADQPAVTSPPPAATPPLPTPVPAAQAEQPEPPPLKPVAPQATPPSIPPLLPIAPLAEPPALSPPAAVVNNEPAAAAMDPPLAPRSDLRSTPDLPLMPPRYDFGEPPVDGSLTEEASEPDQQPNPPPAPLSAATTVLPTGGTETEAWTEVDNVPDLDGMTPKERADIDPRGSWIPPALRGMASDAAEAAENLPRRRRG